MLELPRNQPELVHKHSVHLASPGRGISKPVGACSAGLQIQGYTLA